MPTGDNALQGISEKITDRHIFKVTKDGVLKATGVYIRHQPATGDDRHGNDTGDGWDVGDGDEVEVYNVTVHFIWK
ncbi:hypothetical protein S40293_11616 [Stachybotrys chartarum IBT 40293]|nr:hypothetical protein S40293_11616 [Stachybotrys chartarum IBT 40293]